MVTLLPPSSTPLERALSQTLSWWPEVEAAVDAIATIRTARPSGFSPWLAAEWRLSDFAGYFATPEDLIEAGLPWLKLRGTAAAVKLALSWIGLPAVLTEEDGARLHIDPGRITSLAELAAIRHLVEASLPAHVLFYRLFHGYDLRALRLDRSRLDDALLDDDSGADIDGIKISYRRRHGASHDVPAETVGTSRDRHWRAAVRHDDALRLDLWRLDGELLATPRFVVPARWAGAWDTRSWSSRQTPIHH